MNWFGSLLRAHPDIAFFLALAIGYFIGRFRIGHFSLGSVTGVLLAGVALGQFGVTVAGDVQQIFSCCSCSPSAIAPVRNSSTVCAAVA